MGQNGKRVGVLTTLHSIEGGYSLCQVICEQLETLLHYGYRPTLIVHDDFRADLWGGRVDVAAVIPSVDMAESAAIEQSVAIHKAVGPVVAGLDIVLSHDVFYLPAYLAYNLAARAMAEETHATWFNWCHSGPSVAPPKDDESLERLQGLHSPTPGYVVTLNNHFREGYARQFGMPLSHIKHVRNAHHPLAAAPRLARELFDAAELHRAEVLLVYAGRIDVVGKGLKHQVRVAAEIERLGISCALLVVDCYSDQPHYVEAKKQLKARAGELGYTGLSFTSELHEACVQFTPHGVSASLVGAADVLVMASMGEAGPLIANEAIAGGALLVVNHDVPQLGELFGDVAKKVPFNDAEDKPDEWWRDLAAGILQEVANTRTLRARSRARVEWNPYTVFERQLRPLFSLTNPETRCCGGGDG